MDNYCQNCSKNKECGHSFDTIVKESFIEEVFWEKSLQKPSTQRLLWEWIDSKSVYTKFSGLSRKDFENYSKHDASHSVAILNAITAVIGEDRIQLLGATDLWLLLHCAYGHDIGMHIPYSETYSLWKNMEEGTDFYIFFENCLLSDDEDLKKAASTINDYSKKLGVKISSIFDANTSADGLDTSWVAEIQRNCAYLTAEYVRQQHAERSRHFRLEQCAMYQQYSTSAVDSRFYKIIAQCFSLHGDNLDAVMKLQKHETDVEMGNCHPRFAALMLRLGDLLDISNDRIDWIDLYHYGKLPEISKLHKEKHNAIEHILLNRQEIVLTARSNDERVCVLIDDWFRMIREEVQFLISHWTDFAPKRLSGCMLKAPTLQIYLGKEKFRRSSDTKFKLDKDILIDLVIGRNLYKSRFDFLREYLQNALDASKMKFWLDYSHHNLDYFIEQKGRKRKKKTDEILPFDFSAAVFEQYRIEITYYLEKAKLPDEIYVHLEIVDRGIGIDQECIDAISNIGSGWKKRKQYTKELLIMPKWLRPTGGFGIGMQSGFMITNKISIETKCDFEPTGREVILHSEKNNGRIEEREYSSSQVGTKISVDIPYVWFMDADNYKDYEEKVRPKPTKDFLDPDAAIDVIGNFIKKYLDHIAHKSLFPIVVREKGMKAVTYGRKWKTVKGKYENYTWKKKKYKVCYLRPDTERNINAPEFHIWDVEQDVYCEIQLKDNDEMSETWYYKGIYITDDKEDDGKRQTNDLELFRYVGDFSIDIMGIPVKDCLTVDRNRFQERFDCRSLSNTFALICIEYLAKNKLLLTVVKPTGFQLMRTLIAFHFFNESVQAAVRTSFDDISVENNSNSRMDILLNLYRYNSVDKTIEGFVNDKNSDSEQNGGKGTAVGVGSFLFLCRGLYMQKKLSWAVMPEKDIHEIKEITTEREDAIWDIGKFFNTPKMNLISKLIQKLYPGEIIDCGGIEVHIYDRKQEEENDQKIKEKSSIERIMLETEKKPEKQLYYVHDEMYPELHVTKIPLGSSDHPISDEENVILSPIPQKFLMVDEMVALKEVEDPEEEYVDRIVKEPRFELLVNWIYMYAKHKEYDIATIREKNIELIRKYFAAKTVDKTEED